jgi:adiponectin receptor
MKKQHLFSHDALPAWLKDNEYITGCYRVELSVRQCLHSLWYLHNESVNVWSHLLGFLLVAGIAVYSVSSAMDPDQKFGAMYDHVFKDMRIRAENFADELISPNFRREFDLRLHALWDAVMGPSSNATHPLTDALSALYADLELFFRDEVRTHKAVLVVFLATAMACLAASATFHLFFCHSRRWFNFLCKLDYAGIALLIAGSCVPALHYTFFCHPSLRFAYTLAMTLVCGAAVAVSFVDKFSAPDWRPMRAGMFVAVGACGVVPLVHAAWVLDVDAVAPGGVGVLWTRLLLMGALYVAGAAAYACRVPEKWWPGRFDIWVLRCVFF